MGDKIFDQDSVDIKEDIRTDKKRLEAKEEERANQARKDKVTFTFSWIAIIVRGIVGTFISVFVFTQANRIEDEDTFSRFVLLADHNSNGIENSLANLIQNLKYAGSLYRLFPDISENQFDAFVAPIIQGENYIESIAWHPVPLSANSLPGPLRQAAEKAVLTKQTTAYILETEGDEEDRNSSYINLYVPTLDPQSRAVLGIVAVTLDLKLLISGSLHKENKESTDIYVYAGASPKSTFPIYFYNAEPGVIKNFSVKPEDFDHSEFNTERTIAVGDQSLTLIYEATPQYTEHSWQATIAAGIGVFITSFIVVTAWILLEIEKRQFSNVLHEEHIQEIEGTIDLLETTKNRMVAQENLASLGGLTAGIAHEIKNPLNFINNFSTLSLDLISDIDAFLNKYHNIGTPEERNSIYESMHSLRENVHVIYDQGQRANSTIQRMLAHSRGKPGEWGRTDIHKLLEEYISFSYHGMRAKNSNFNVKIEKEFLSAVKDIDVVGNDMSRVFLNLLNNAFQSVEEKKKRFGETYTNPLVAIKTHTVGNYMRIRIYDNGMGIPEENKANIFTPFFTTKPTGLGTGLGLSLSYNIIVREHGGSLTFDSKESEYCEFIITIPLQPKKEKEVVNQ